MKINKQLIKDGYISERKHPECNYFIYNYTQKTQYEQFWNEDTMNCRGLILDGEGNIIAKPFSKFFNIGEYSEQNDLGKIPNYTWFDIWDKMDGCFTYNTKLNCWDGSTVKIGDLVSKNLNPILIGRDKRGNLVPCKITNRFDNGTKDHWLDIVVDTPVSKKSGVGNFNNKLRVTYNHKIYVNNQWDLAMNIKIGDNLTTYDYFIDKNVEHFINSSLLGDGSLYFNHNSFTFGESHAKRFKKYLNWINHCLGECSGKPRELISGYGTEMIQCISKSLKTMRFLRNNWYKNGKKILPEDISWIDDFSIAKLYMDDGSIQKNKRQYQLDRAIFATYNFSKKDNQRLAKKIEDMYGVKCVLQKTKHKYYGLRINAGRKNEIQNFWKRIEKYIHPDFKYKLPDKYQNEKFIDYPKGKLNILTNNVKILDIKKVEINKNNFPSGRKGFDIETTTHNYFAKGVLVHNSLGILYKMPNGELRIATRGSFSSDQAIEGTMMFNQMFDKPELIFNDDCTYLFEIIYPENRIVVDYKEKHELVLLAVKHKYSDKEKTYEELLDFASKFNIPLTQYYGRVSYNRHAFLKIEGDIPEGNEGFVLKFDNGLRVKIKSEEYKRLHRILTQTSNKSVWELLRNHQDINELLDRVPDEFYQWTRNTVYNFNENYKSIEHSCQIIVNKCKFKDRKDVAEYFCNKENKIYRGILFLMYDNKDYEDVIWKMLRPEYSKPFAEEK